MEKSKKKKKDSRAKLGMIGKFSFRNFFCIINRLINKKEKKVRREQMDPGEIKVSTMLPVYT